MRTRHDEKNKPRKTKRSNKGARKRNEHRDGWSNFLHESVFQIIGLVCIAITIGYFFYFLSVNNMRGTFWSAVGVVIFVLVLIALVADRHFFAHRNSVKTVSSKVARDQGALMVIANIAAEPREPQVGQPLRIVITFINRGHSPAKKMRSIAVVEPVASGQSPKLEYSDDTIVRVGTIDPGVAHDATLFPGKHPTTGEEHAVTQEMLDALRTGRIRLFVHGRIDYEDAGKQHWKTYCYFLTTPLNGKFAVWTEKTNQTDD